jgi:hypothetical protein
VIDKTGWHLFALTLWRPWPNAILHGGKRIENRSWIPGHRFIEELICIHAGLKYDHEGAHRMIDQKLYEPPNPSECPSGVIVGAARIMGFITTPRYKQKHDDPWFFGPYGWILDDVIEFSEPIQCRGAQGLWRVKGDALERCREEINKYVCICGRPVTNACKECGRPLCSLCFECHASLCSNCWVDQEWARYEKKGR